MWCCWDFPDGLGLPFDPPKNEESPRGLDVARCPTDPLDCLPVLQAKDERRRYRERDQSHQRRQTAVAGMAGGMSLSSLRDWIVRATGYPALTCWATFCRPSGTSYFCSDLRSVHPIFTLLPVNS